MQEKTTFRLHRTLIATWLVVVVCGTLAAWAVRVGNEALGDQALNPQGWAAAYERTYGHLEGLPQPQITRLELALDIFADEERLSSRGSVVVRNDSPVRVPELHLTAPRRTESLSFRVPGNMLPADEAFPLRRYRLQRPLEPGETLLIRFALDVDVRGRKGELRFGPADFLLHVGYDPALELRNERARRRQGLPPRSEPLLREGSETRSLDHFHATVSTSADHVAIAPGTATRHWLEDGRAFLEYTAAKDVAAVGFSVRSRRES